MHKEQEYLEKLLKADKPDANCPVHRALNQLQGKWKTNVLFELLKQDSIRFNGLKKKIPFITGSMLSSVLRNLEKSNLVVRVQYNEIPPRVEYSLSPKGKGLLPVLAELTNWIEKVSLIGHSIFDF